MAIVEIANESGLVHYWLWDRLDDMAEPLLAELQRKWNVWLADKYVTDDALNTAWGGTSASVEILQNTELTEPFDPWTLEMLDPAAALLSVEENADGTNPAFRIDITTPGDADYKVQLTQPGLTLASGVFYLISMRVKASSDRPFTINLQNSNDPWNFFTPWTIRDLTEEWQDFTVTYAASDEAGLTEDIRLQLSGFGLDTGTVWISSPSVLAGGPVLETGETLSEGTVPLIEQGGIMSWNDAAVRDWLAFLRDTETSYYTRTPACPRF